MAEGKRPVTFRTRKLSPPAPMVLHSGGCGRVGHRRTIFQFRATPNRGGPELRCPRKTPPDRPQSRPRTRVSDGLPTPLPALHRLAIPPATFRKRRTRPPLPRSSGGEVPRIQPLPRAGEPARHFPEVAGRTARHPATSREQEGWEPLPRN